MEEIRHLVESSRSGDLDAFAALVGRFQNMAHGCAYAILGDFHEAEDAAQEAFIECYQRLSDLREPEAFPGWFRRILVRKCRQMLRRPRLQTAPLEEAFNAGREPIATGPDPGQAAALRETQRRVLDAIRSLPEGQRMATTLFYIDGYSLNEVAEFLEAPVTTVKKRLHDSRRKLKERMLTMVEETLKSNTPDDKGFASKVIAELLARPNLMEIEAHPVRKVAESLFASFPGFERVEGDEVVRKSNLVCSDEPSPMAFRVDSERFLRTSTTGAALLAMKGHALPARLITAGRAFRSGASDATHAQVFHMMDIVCVDRGVRPDDMREAAESALRALFTSPRIEWRETQGLAPFDNPMQIWLPTRSGEPLLVAVAGMLTADALRRGLFDPEEASGYGIGIGLDRLAMLQHGIDHVGKLWQPPFVRG
jgi:RNA polymerase sigma factor (sigma-70 family)